MQMMTPHWQQQLLKYEVRVESNFLCDMHPIRCTIRCLVLFDTERRHVFLLNKSTP